MPSHIPLSTIGEIEWNFTPRNCKSHTSKFLFLYWKIGTMRELQGRGNGTLYTRWMYIGMNETRERRETLRENDERREYDR